MTCRSSVIAARPAASTASIASRASSGDRSSTVRAAPACAVITLTLCVTTSCSSCAIRARSRSTAKRVAFACWASMFSACWRDARAVLIAKMIGMSSSSVASPGFSVGRSSLWKIAISAVPAIALAVAAAR